MLLGIGMSGWSCCIWGIALFTGVGLLHNVTNSPFGISNGIQGQCRISKVSMVLELSDISTFQDFAGYNLSNRLDNHIIPLIAELTFHFDKVGWKRAMDVVPYIRLNGRLVDYTSLLSEENRRCTGHQDQDRRTLTELKKILKIERQLDTYKHLLTMMIRPGIIPHK